MGIGNTTSAAAITLALTRLPAGTVVGPGTGIDPDALERKTELVSRSVRRRRLHGADPMRILAGVGGFEIGAMCGACLAAAASNTPVVVDGFISTSAAALAVGLCDEVRGYLFAAHRSKEPGHAGLLRWIGHEPLLDLGMHLGEGTGAALGIGLIRSAVAAFTGMSTFEDALVSERSAGG